MDGGGEPTHHQGGEPAFAGGVDRLVSGQLDGRWGRLRRARTAVVTHAAATTGDLRSTLAGLVSWGLHPKAVVTPEHGFTGCGAPGQAEAPGATPELGGIRWVDGYLGPPEAIAERLDGVEVLVVDLADIGVRCTTYVSLLDDTLQAAARLGAAVVVLDRPNPLGRTVYGPVLDPGLRSYVGRVPAPLRHGLTLGEAARLIAPAEVALDVVTVAGWDGQAALAHPERPWVPPSPNLPTAMAALCYAGTVLFEGTSGAEPRGTTSPFQTIGVDWLDEEIVEALRGRDLPGLEFRAAVMAPLWGSRTGGVLPAIAYHVTDHHRANPIRATIELLHAAVEQGAPVDFDKHFALVAGRQDLAEQVAEGTSVDAIEAGWRAAVGTYLQQSEGCLLYGPLQAEGIPS